MSVQKSVNDDINTKCLFREIPFCEIENYYRNMGCVLLLKEDEYLYGQKTIAPYICSCGRRQDGRTIQNFKKNNLCEFCRKEMARRKKAFSLGNDYESVNERMINEDKQLLSYREYFIGEDDITYKCTICGTENTIKYREYNTGKHICKGCRKIQNKIERWNNNVEFAHEHGLEVLSTIDSFENKNSKIKLRCKCGNEFETEVNELRNGGKIQCNDCGIKMRSGENSPRWNGGVTSKLEILRKSKEYGKWREFVFKRDNYTCQCCGDSSGSNLNAHHILNFSQNENLRYVESNGITMCDKCHNPNQKGSFHNIFGTYNNTLEQLQKYFDIRRTELKLPLVKLEDILT